MGYILFGLVSISLILLLKDLLGWVQREWH